MTDDATPKDGTSLGAPGMDEGTSPEQIVTESEIVASARKRQAGAEAARQVAEAKAKDYEVELAKFRTAAQSEADKDLSELVRQTARADAAEKRAADAEAKANERILDAKYPNARKEYSEVVDEAKLAKLEAMLRDDDEVSTPPTPRGNNPPKDGTGSTVKKETTLADIEASLAAQIAVNPTPWAT